MSKTFQYNHVLGHFKSNINQIYSDMCNFLVKNIDDIFLTNRDTKTLMFQNWLFYDKEKIFNFDTGKSFDIDLAGTEFVCSLYDADVRQEWMGVGHKKMTEKSTVCQTRAISWLSNSCSNNKPY